MKKIWKYDVGNSETSMKIPKDSKILHLAVQRGVPNIWVLVNPENERVTRKFCIYGTGHEIPDDDTVLYIGTFHAPPFVWHLFEVIET